MIVPMKKAKIVVLKEDKDKLLHSLQKHSVFMPIPQDDTIIDASLEESLIQRTENSLKLIRKLKKEKSFFKDYYVIGYENFIKSNPIHQEILTNIEKANEEISHLKSNNTALNETIDYFKAWFDLDIKLSELKSSKYTHVQTGFVIPRNLEESIEFLDQSGCVFQVLAKAEEGIAIVFATYINDRDEIINKLKTLGFIENELPKEDLFVHQIIDNKQKEIDNNQQRIDELQQLLTKYTDEIAQLELFNDQMATQRELKKVKPLNLLETSYLEGWIREDEIETFKQAITEVIDFFDLEICQPQKGEETPTATKNPKLIKQFETVTNMFSIPTIDGLDPNPIMAPWYWLIFGMMIGDAGYGLMMIALFAFLINALKPKGDGLKMMRIFLYSGVSSIIWGVLFGSYFGFAWNPILLIPMDKPMELLVISLVIGGVHIITGVLAKAYYNIRNNRIAEALSGQISWVLVLVGIALLAIGNQIAMPLIITGLSLVVILGGLKYKNIFGKIFGGFGGLYSITGFMSDILSYSRILAICLSTGIVAMVMNMLAGMLQGGNVILFAFSFVVYVFGHVFNLAMGLLSAYVHTGRLQYIEFFNKFFEGGGYEFKPLSLQLKYIDQVNNK